MLIYFGLLLVAAFLMQGALGFIQIRNFSHVFHRLRLIAPVAIGKSPKKFRAGTLILMAVKSDGQIVEAQIMQGVTIFTKFKELKSLRGENIAEVAASYDQLHQLDKLTRICFLDAYRNYVSYRTNQLVSQDFDSSVQIWSLPLVEKGKSLYYKMLQKHHKKQIN